MKRKWGSSSTTRLTPHGMKSEFGALFNRYSLFSCFPLVNIYANALNQFDLIPGLPRTPSVLFWFEIVTLCWTQRACFLQQFSGKVKSPAPVQLLKTMLKFLSSNSFSVVFAFIFFFNISLTYSNQIFFQSSYLKHHLSFVKLGQHGKITDINQLHSPLPTPQRCKSVLSLTLTWWWSRGNWLLTFFSFLKMSKCLWKK